jgi:Tol biopolymer transport system component
MQRTFTALVILAGVAGQGCREHLGPDVAAPVRLKGVLVFSSTDRDNRAEASQLYRIGTDGRDLEPILLGVSRNASQPDVSPDGRRIAFVSNGDVHVADADGGDDRNLTLDPGFDTWPVWSPDGNQIAFGSNRDQAFGQYDIFIVNVDGSSLRKVISGGWTPAWSPDGRRIAFTLNDADGRHIFVATLADGSITQITAGPYLDDSPSWSPDGTELVFGSTRGTTNELYLIKVDGSNIRRLPVPGFFGHWSPDGRRIAFECAGAIVRSHVCLINVDGSGFVMLTADSTVSDFGPAWSP